jgi:flagellar protein FliJ
MSGSASKMHLPEWKRSRRINELPKFIFNLETLLKYREDIEQRERDELFRLTYRFQTELRHRDDLVLKSRETMNELSRKRSENSDHGELNLFHLYLDRLSHEIEESEKRMVQLQAEVQAQKEVVIEASKQKKVLASLKSKREKEFAAAVEKQEQKEIDDLVITRFKSGDSEYQATVDRGKSKTEFKQGS